LNARQGEGRRAHPEKRERKVGGRGEGKENRIQCTVWGRKEKKQKKRKKGRGRHLGGDLSCLFPLYNLLTSTTPVSPNSG